MNEISYVMGKQHGRSYFFDDNRRSSLGAKGDFYYGLRSGEYIFILDAKENYKRIEYFLKGKPIKNTIICKRGTKSSELVLAENKDRYIQLIIYNENGTETTSEVPDYIEKDFLYGMFLYLPDRFL